MKWETSLQYNERREVRFKRRPFRGNGKNLAGRKKTQLNRLLMCRMTDVLNAYKTSLL